MHAVSLHVLALSMLSHLFTVPPCSISFPYIYDLKDNKAVKGSNITLSIDLVGGTTFKIIGLMLCNR